MPPRLTVDQVRFICQSKKVSLIGGYTDCTSPITVECENNHRFDTSLKSIRSRKKGCLECPEEVVRHNKLTIEQVSAICTEKNVRLAGEYINARTPIKVICQQNHTRMVTVENLRKWSKCPKCKTRGEKKIIRLSFESVKKEIESFGCKLLESTYLSNSTRMKMECPLGHQFSSSLQAFRSAQEKCRFCRKHTRGVSRRMPINELRDLIRDNNFTLDQELPETPVSRTTKIKLRCPMGHPTTKTIQKIRIGQKCAICSGRAKFTYDQIVKIFLERKYTVLSTSYTKSGEPILVRCPLGHETFIRPNNFISKGSGCKICYDETHGISDTPLTINKLASVMWARISDEIRKQGVKPKDVKIVNRRKRLEELAKEVLSILGDRPTNHEMDHILPCAFFNHTKEDEIFLCWQIENLRWLPRLENYAKRDRVSDDILQSLTFSQIEALFKGSFVPVDVINRFNQIESKSFALAG